MNKLSTFSQLTTRVAEIGYTVNKVTGCTSNQTSYRSTKHALKYVVVRP
jgi:hypothetical protein